jgi:hypothetical protein
VEINNINNESEGRARNVMIFHTTVPSFSYHDADFDK